VSHHPSPQGAYRVPACRHRVEEVIRGSRFITTVDRASDEEEARSFIQEIRLEFTDATHTCWAYVAGSPGDTARIGFSDAGEPHGTAGRPMLEALLHSSVGEVAAVATRYYGGTKLGRGGLGRAYAGGVKLALESLPTRERVDRVRIEIEIGYPAVDPLHRFLEKIGAVREDETYGAHVRITAAIPVGSFDEVARVVADLTSGSGRARPLT